MVWAGAGPRGESKEPSDVETFDEVECSDTESEDGRGAVVEASVWAEHGGLGSLGEAGRDGVGGGKGGKRDGTFGRRRRRGSGPGTHRADPGFDPVGVL